MKILIAGGGASGFMAAITAKRLYPDCRAVIIEKNDRVLKKVLASGNGRCNITNKNINPRFYNKEAGKFIERTLLDFSYSHAASFFSSIGVPFCEEEGGKVYPMSRQASSVVDLLRAEACRLGIEEICSSRIVDVKIGSGGFIVKTVSGDIFGDRLVAAFGSSSGGGSVDGYGLLKKLGHSITDLYPSIVQIKAFGTKAFKGVKFNGRVLVSSGTKILGADYGEILFTEYGFSGPPIMRLSRLVSCETSNLSKKTEIFVDLDLTPEFSFGELLRFLTERSRALPELPLELFLTGIINKKLSFGILKAAGLKLSSLSSSLSGGELRAVSSVIKKWRFKACGVMPFGNSQATAGGVSLDEIEPDTMQSRKVKGLFVTGELLNVDGVCGGYNLHWAWASGYKAGKSLL